MKQEEEKLSMVEKASYFAALTFRKLDTDENQIFIHKKSEDGSQTGYAYPEGSMAICLQPKNPDNNLIRASVEEIKELCGNKENSEFILEYYMDMLERQSF